MKPLKFFLFMILFISCNKNNNTFKSTDLEFIKSINKLEDGTYISDVRNIKNYNNQIYLTDYKRNQVIVLDKNLNLKNTFGSTGRGPGDFLGAFNIFVDNSNIYVTNDGKKSIEVFNNYKYSYTIYPPEDIKFNPQLSFFKKGPNYYICSPDNEYNFTKFDSIGNAFRFGSLTNYENKSEEIIKNECHLINYQNKVISISNIRPEINIYDLKGKFLSKYDYSNLDIVKSFTKFIKTKESKFNSFYVLASDVSLDKNKLYLKVPSYKNNKVQSHKILELELLDDNIKPKRIINLGKGWFENFSIKDNTFFGFDAISGNLIKSKIRDNEL
ncbi:6-bladed beta-propeller [Polaribacter cellanae]|uniref:6-bladed beta-propeller n=1 Tax=Polaribacter cellanae TaxID=2818493 RepID=A0A975CU76_9FLAO|nr:6-bladed beta-propeller [Polaribacter cellanae]QTE23546.1 6-bladed beta-propeller [Polaribacter cellanae]